MKIEPKFTKGPWHRNIPPATKYPTVYAGRNKHLAYVNVGLPPEEVDANASLIAAAPEMLEMIKKLHARLDEFGQVWGMDDEILSGETERLIKKATTI